MLDAGKFFWKRGFMMKRSIRLSVILFLVLLFQCRGFCADLPTVMTLRGRLAAEVQKMVDAGHLAPGICYFEQHYFVHSSPSRSGHWEWDDYWHNPADLVYTLSIAIPHLPAEMQGAAKTYLENEFNSFPPYTYVHTGPSGLHRSINGVPPDYETGWPGKYAQRSSSATSNSGYPGYSFNPFNVYACWKFAQLFPGRTNEILSNVQGKLHALPTDMAFLETHPHTVNQYIAGYYGYLGLLALAGQAPDATVQGWLDSALGVRVQILDYDPRNLDGYEAGGFCWLVPELGAYLHDHAGTRILQILEYENWARPYWFISRAQECTRYSPDRIFMEGYHAQIYDYFSLFQVRALALGLNQQELKKYLDVSAVHRGDLYYIQNLVYTINPSADNQGPLVNAGEDQTIELPQNTVNLDGHVIDDGKPSPPAAVNVIWTQQSGPQTVVFADPCAPDTIATLPAAGTYTLRLTASDGLLSGFDEIDILVKPEMQFFAVDVNNPSFELPGVVNPNTGEYSYKNEWENVPGWSSDGTIDAGISKPTIAESGFAPTDGEWGAFAGGSDSFYQLLDQIITAGETYALYFDALNVTMWQGPANVTARFYYDRGAGREVIAEIIVTFIGQDNWHYDRTLEFTAQAGADYTGYNLGIEFANTAVDSSPGDGTIQTWNYIDDLKVERGVLFAAPAGDLNNDGTVNYKDLNQLEQSWLWSGQPGAIPEDIIEDGIVDLKDFAAIVNHWLD